MRHYETIGIPSMFRSRVSGVGISYPTAEEQQRNLEQIERNRPALAEYQRKLAAWGVGLKAAQEQCPPGDPNIQYIQARVCQPAVDYMNNNPRPVEPGDVPDSMMSPAPTAFSLPLIIGAAYLLLS